MVPNSVPKDLKIKVNYVDILETALATCNDYFSTTDVWPVANSLINIWGPISETICAVATYKTLKEALISYIATALATDLRVTKYKSLYNIGIAKWVADMVLGSCV